MTEPIDWTWLGRRDYEPLWRAMQTHTDERDDTTPDELWFAEHPPVYTLGLAGDPSHVLAPGEIPVVKTDRGGQVTYHGPGQLMLYPLLNIRRAGIGVRALVCALERAVIEWCAANDIDAYGKRDAPGVYVGEQKLASIGIRVRRGCCYHGLALNVAMDLEPFSRINPCGFAGLEMTDLARLGLAVDLTTSAERLASYFSRELTAAAPCRASA